MTAGVAGLLAEGENDHRAAETAAVSYPTLLDDPRVARRSVVAAAGRRPMLIVASGPSGAGKDAVLGRVRELLPSVFSSP